MERINFIMMVELPGSGKSSAAINFAELYDANIHSSDDIREELFGNAKDQNHNHKVFETLHKRIKGDIENGKACIYDATNISYKRRLAFLQEIRGFARKCDVELNCICVLICTPVEQCFKWNKRREREVPFEVIDKMYKNFDIPYYYEGWDDIQLVYPIRGFESYYGDIDSYIVRTLDYDQKNSHHKLSLGWHLEKARQLSYSEDIVGVAAALHDCGKPYCATFKNMKGETTEDCHYYGHERVGAYMALFFDNFKYPINRYQMLNSAIIIRWHMQPYFMDREAFIKKYSPILKENLIYRVLKVHDADVAAH